MSINTNYYNYSNSLFSNTSNVNTTSNTMYDLLMADNASKNSYGTNNASQVSEGISDYMSDVKTESGNIKASLEKLLGKGKMVSAFDERTPASSDTDVLSIKSYQSSKSSSLSNVNVQIDKVATTQKNQGNDMTATGKSFTGGSYHQFEITVDGKKHQISFTVGSGDDNWDVQQKMAEAINKKDIGITANVSYDSKTKTSALTLESNNTGIKSGASEVFSIRDISGSAVSTTGVGAVTQKAENAVYSVNGGSVKTSQSNDVDLGNGVVATLKKASSSDVTISMKQDSTTAINKVREMVNGFNELLSVAQDNDSDRGAKRLVNELSNLASSYGASLGRIGISVNKDGYLEIDKDKMQKAAETGELEKFFKGNGENSNYGFANRLARTAEKANNDPTEYLSVQATNSMKSSEYQNNTTSNYLFNNRYNQLLNTGMLFDMLF